MPSYWTRRIVRAVSDVSYYVWEKNVGKRAPLLDSEAFWREPRVVRRVVGHARRDRWGRVVMLP